MAARHQCFEITVRLNNPCISLRLLVGDRAQRNQEKLMVATSNHVLVNMADFGDDLEIEGDVLAAKRTHDDDDTSGGESDRTSGKSA